MASGFATTPALFLYPLVAGVLVGLFQIVIYFVGHMPVSDAVEQALEGTSLAEVFDWFNLGRVPAAILLMLLFVAFGASGILLTGLLPVLPPWIVAFVAAPVAVLATKAAGDGLARVLPRDETYAVTADAFVGLEGTVTLGPLDDGPAGNVIVRDVHGEVHTLRARPIDTGTRIEQGSRVVVVARDETHRGRVFLVMPFAA